MALSSEKCIEVNLFLPSFTSSASTRESSTMTAVELVGSMAPNIHASRWLPSIT